MKNPVATILQLVVIVFWLQISAKANGAYVFKIASDSSLKDVFDAGLRPWKYNGDFDTCNISDALLTFKFDNNKTVSDFPVESGFIEVERNYLIDTAHFTTPLLEMSAAVSMVNRIASELSISTAGLEKVASVVPTGTTYLPPQAWSQREEIGGADTQLMFVVMHGSSKVQALISFNFSWKHPLRPDVIWNTSMPAPLGYEKIGFGTPPPSKGPPLPNPGLSYYENLVLAKKGAHSSPGTRPTESSSSPTPTLTVASSRDVKKSSAWLYALIVLVAVGTGAVVLLGRKK